MSANLNPAPAPVLQPPVNEQDFKVEGGDRNPHLLRHNFILSADGKSATRTFRLDNSVREFKITVYFPDAAASTNEKNRRLEHFSDQNLQLIAREAQKLGLGKEENEIGKNGPIKAILFKQNEQGELLQAEKYFAKLPNNPKVITRAYYEAKIANKDTPKEKKEKLQQKLQIFSNAQLVWNHIKNPRQPMPILKRPEQNPPIPNQNDKKFDDEMINNVVGEDKKVDLPKQQEEQPIKNEQKEEPPVKKEALKEVQKEEELVKKE